MPDVSVKDFKRILSDENHEVCREKAWNFDVSAEHGYAFQLWYGRLISNAEASFDTDAEDAMLYSKDLGVDLVFEDTSTRRLLLVQCKYVKAQIAVDEDEVMSFFDRHELLMDRDWISSHGSQQAVDALIDYADRIDDGWSVELRFVSTGTASQRVKEAAAARATLGSEGQDVVGTLVDFTDLKTFYTQASTLQQSIPEVVKFHLRSEKFFRLEDPYQTIVAAISGNELRNLVAAHKQSLFAYNIRGYLGPKGMNRALKQTVAEEPQNFFCYNNGVSAICTSFAQAGHEITAYDFQIINGAQTVNALRDAGPSADVMVLFRLMKAEDVKTEKGINAKIIKYNNSQNVVKLSDFRANDPIQLWLEEHLRSIRPSPGRKFYYVRRRGLSETKPHALGTALRLEDFAKIRHAFLDEPTLTQAAPKDLWTPEAEGGRYEKVFGHEGKLLAHWPRAVLNQGLLAVAAYFHISDDLTARTRKSPDLRFLQRLRFHSVSLVGKYVRENLSEREVGQLIVDAEAFADVLGVPLQVQRDVLVDTHDNYVPERMTMFAFVRSSDRWSDMEKRFAKKLAAR